MQINVAIFHALYLSDELYNYYRRTEGFFKNIKSMFSVFIEIYV